MDRQECLSDRETLDFADDFGGRKAAAFPADEGDDAVGAAGVAAVLDFESGAGVIPFSAEDGGGEQRVLFENITGEDLAELGRNMLRSYKGMEAGSGVWKKRGCREKVVRRFGGRNGGEGIDELGDLGFVGIADDPGDAGEGSELFGGALGVAASDNKADGGVGGVKLANGVAGLGIGGGGDSAGIDDDDVGGSGRGGRGATAVEQLALDGSAISLRGAATELFDEERRHPRARPKKTKEFTQSPRSTQRT